MSSDTNAFNEYFKDQQFKFKNNNGLNLVFNLDYNVYTGLLVTLRDEDAFTDKYDLVFQPDTAEEFDAAMHRIIPNWTETIPTDIILPAYEFLSLIPEAITVNVELDDDDSKNCPFCGHFHPARFSAYFLPAYGHEEDTVHVKYKLCHFQENTSYSETSSGKLNAPLRIIDNAIREATDEDSKLAIMDFKEKLRQKLMRKAWNGFV